MPSASRAASDRPAAQLADQIDRAWQRRHHRHDADSTAGPPGPRRRHKIARMALAIDAEAAGANCACEAVQLLGEVGQPACIAAILELVDIRRAAADCNWPRSTRWPRSTTSGSPTALLERFPASTTGARVKTCDVLLGRKTWAAAAAGKRSIADRSTAKEIAVDQLRLVALHNDSTLDALVKKHWGSIQGGTPEERLAEMRRINNDLRAGHGDAAAGKTLFTKHCGTCHRLFGEGNQVGPELTHANRKNTDELLATIVSPSAVIRKEYLSFLVQTSDGRVLTGLLVEQTPGSVTLLDAKNERTTIAARQDRNDQTSRRRR